MKYCVYITFYRGNKLPPFYIGSSSIEKVNDGYHGSVKSKQYMNIWKSELKNNPHLFKTKIISEHDTRVNSLEKECKLQKLLNVVKSTMYINKSIAAPNGFFGMQVPKESHPSYNKNWSIESREMLGESRTKYFEENDIIWINDGKNSKMVEKSKYQQMVGWVLGRLMNRKIVTCDHCGGSGYASGMMRTHFNNCRYHQEKLQTALASIEERKENLESKSIEYFGNMYKTYKELKSITGCSKYLYMKYYKIGINPEPFF